MRWAGDIASQLSSQRLSEQKLQGLLSALSSWGLPGRTCIMNLAGVSGARGALVAGQHHHELCRREGAGFERVQVSDPRRHWARPGARRDRAWSGRSSPPLKVHGVPSPLRSTWSISSNSGTHQWLPQESRCCLPQLCHRDPPIPVPVKLRIPAGLSPPTLSCAHCHLAWTPPLPPSNPPPPPRLRP